MFVIGCTYISARFKGLDSIGCTSFRDKARIAFDTSRAEFGAFAPVARSLPHPRIFKSGAGNATRATDTTGEDLRGTEANAATPAERHQKR